MDIFHGYGYYYQNSIKQVHENILQHEIFTGYLSDELITDLFYYWFITYPKVFNLTCAQILIDQVRQIYDSLPDNSIILAPGESPFKIIQLIDMLYGQTDKKLTFISFPLSGISSLPEDQYRLLDQVFQIVLIKYNLNSNDNILYMDYIYSGSSQEKILESVRRVFNEPDFNFSRTINLNFDFPEDCSDLIREISDSEVNNSRCIRSHKLVVPLDQDFMENKYSDNLLRCNVSIIILYLIAIQNPIFMNLASRLNHETYSQIASQIYPFMDKYSDIVYYDIDTLNYQTVTGIIEYSDQSVITVKGEVIIRLINNPEKYIIISPFSISTIKSYNYQPYSVQQLEQLFGQNVILDLNQEGTISITANLESVGKISGKNIILLTMDGKKKILIPIPLIVRVRLA